MTQTRDELITEAMPLIKIAARKFKLPPGLNVDDLESAGNEAILEAASRFDPGGGSAWKNYAWRGIKMAMRNVVDVRRNRRHVHTPLQPAIDGEVMAPPIDKKAHDPSEIAETRELMRRPRQQLSVKRIQSNLPSPCEVADQVTRLRSAMFGAVSETDVTEVMEAVLRKAKAGDMRAATMITDLLAPGRSGVTVHQQVVAIRSEDID